MAVKQNILEQLKKGSTKAFEELFFMYKDKVFSFVYNSIYDKHISEDILQNVFLSIWEHRETIDTDKNFDAFIFTIARNLVYRYTEKKLQIYQFNQKFTNEFSEITQSAEEEIDSKILFEAFMLYVNKLPEKRREIFVMNKIEGLSIKEISNRLALSPKTVENQVHRAILYLKKNLPKQIVGFFILLLLNSR